MRGVCHCVERKEKPHIMSIICEVPGPRKMIDQHNIPVLVNGTFGHWEKPRAERLPMAFEIPASLLVLVQYIFIFVLSSQSV
jgi:hypothetical protein